MKMRAGSGPYKAHRGFAKPVHAVPEATCLLEQCIYLWRRVSARDPAPLGCCWERAECRGILLPLARGFLAEDHYLEAVLVSPLKPEKSPPRNPPGSGIWLPLSILNCFVSRVVFVEPHFLWLSLCRVVGI